MDPMSRHVVNLLALEAARALDPKEEARVAAHLRVCADCAARAEEWRALAGGLRDLPGPKPSPGLLARTREAVERQQVEREERAWNRAALGFVIVFGWTLVGVVWFVFDLVLGELAVRFDRPLGPTVLWFAAYLAAGWVTAGAAAVLLGRRSQEEGRMA
jgi:anti-sigma factor RsiW